MLAYYKFDFVLLDILLVVRTWWKWGKQEIFLTRLRQQREHVLLPAEQAGSQVSGALIN
jgi:low temperature requirement protein LtrA